MTKEELKKSLNKCPECGKKPEGFAVIGKLKENFLERRPTDRTRKYYQLKCSCGIRTNAYEDRNKTIIAWNECNFAGIIEEARKSA